MIVRDKDGNVVALSRDSVTWTNLAGGVTAVGEAMSVEMTANERAVLGELLCPTPPRCATCRWAEANPFAAFAPPQFPLLCSLAGGDNGIQGDGAVDFTPAAAPFAVDASEWGRLTVAPDFGCVMWEARP